MKNCEARRMAFLGKSSCEGKKKRNPLHEKKNFGRLVVHIGVKVEGQVQ